MKNRMLSLLVVMVVAIMAIGLADSTLAAGREKPKLEIIRPAWLPEGTDVRVDVNFPFFVSPDGSMALVVVAEDESQLADAKRVLKALDGWKNTMSQYPPEDKNITVWLGVYLPLAERQTTFVEAAPPEHYKNYLCGRIDKRHAGGDTPGDEVRAAINDDDFPKAFRGAVARVILKSFSAKPVYVEPPRK